MKTSLLILVCAVVLSCNNETASETKTEAPMETTPAGEKDAPGKPARKSEQKETVQTIDDLTPVIGEIDMGDYIFRVHEIVPYHPNEMQAQMMKLNDNERDYFLVDASVESRSDGPLYTGKDILSGYFILSDGSTYKNPMKGAVIIGSYNVNNKGNYSQKKYDQIWGHKFPAKGIARTILYGVEASEGVSIKAIGFHKTDAAKNKFTDLK